MLQQTSPDYRSLMTKALIEIKDLKARLKKHDQERTEPIAVIGMACRFPGRSDTPEKYWKLLSEGVDAITDVPDDRWDIDRFHLPDGDHTMPGRIASRKGGFLDDVKGFDPGFFGISPRECESLDPHQRMILEASWESLENANIVPETLFGTNAGVFVGVSSMDNVIRLMGEAPLADMDAYYGTGCALSPIAGRISYSFGFTGPSFIVDTACSSSLLSLHLAAESLRRRECDLALGGGVHLLFHPGISVAFSQAQMLSPDGRCKTFDASANGYVRGEGCGMVVLKRLSDAVRDKDNIIALIRGSAVNQDGASGGLTVPSGPSQEQVVQRALDRSGIEPSKVSYIEAHGTGTPLGDPIEIGALVNVLGKGREKVNPLIVGSVKTNIGHLEASAGIAGVIKVVLALKNRAIPPHLNLKQPNPLIPWSEIPIHIPTTLTPWQPVEGEERIAGISSFGFSGTNVHMIISGAESILKTTSDAGKTENIDSDRPRLLVISARTDEALRTLAKEYFETLSDKAGQWSQICANAATTRTQFPRRFALTASNMKSARDILAEFVQQEYRSVEETDIPRVAFLFTGQGAQYPEMGKELYQTEPLFRQTMDECDSILLPVMSLSIIDLLYGRTPASVERLAGTDLTQPLLFCLEYSLARLLMSWGVHPDSLMGHSVGEYVAACIAGIFSLEDGLKLIAERARLMSQLPEGGSMAAIFADAAVVEKVINDISDEPDNVQTAVERKEGSLKSKIGVAAFNSPRNTVISGSRSAVEAVVARIKAQKTECRTLKVSHAFHSHLMEPMLAEFGSAAQRVKYSQPRIAVMSNISGKKAGSEIATPDYWVSHVRSPVRFSDSIKELLKDNHDMFIEIGPSATLTAMARQINKAEKASWLPTMRKNIDPRHTLLESLGRYWIQGGSVDLKAVTGEPDKKISLPTYPFQHRPYWKEIPVDEPRTTLSGVKSPDHPLIMRKLSSPLLRETLFESVFSTEKMPFLEDHRVFGKLVVAGATHLSLVLGAAIMNRPDKSADQCCLKDVIFPQALVVPDNGQKVVQLSISHADSQGVSEFRLISLDKDGEQEALHANGKITLQATADSRTANGKMAMQETANVRTANDKMAMPDTAVSLMDSDTKGHTEDQKNITTIWS
ncbi:MAG: acyltransferase domain-containing protein, partial [Desulfamplus sp.]|nr:acyltransferase domain-containing protein [Desulfamplus sp.]